MYALHHTDLEIVVRETELNQTRQEAELDGNGSDLVVVRRQVREG